MMMFFETADKLTRFLSDRCSGDSSTSCSTARELPFVAAAMVARQAATKNPLLALTTLKQVSLMNAFCKYWMQAVS